MGQNINNDNSWFTNATPSQSSVSGDIYLTPDKPQNTGKKKKLLIIATSLVVIAIVIISVGTFIKKETEKNNRETSEKLLSIIESKYDELSAINKFYVYTYLDDSIEYSPIYFEESYKNGIESTIAKLSEINKTFDEIEVDKLTQNNIKDSFNNLKELTKNLENTYKKMYEAYSLYYDVFENNSEESMNKLAEIDDQNISQSIIYANKNRDQLLKLAETGEIKIVSYIYSYGMDETKLKGKYASNYMNEIIGGIKNDE